MEGFRVDPNAHVPPSVQIVEAVLDAVATARFVAGDRLPSVRALAVEVLVNPNTVGKAYAELERLGVVAGRNGSGVYVAEGGAARAVELRQASTLADFVAAAETALRAGHPADVLGEVLGAAAAAVAVGALGGPRPALGDRVVEPAAIRQEKKEPEGRKPRR